MLQYLDLQLLLDLLETIQLCLDSRGMTQLTPTGHPHPHKWQPATSNVAATPIDATANVDLNLVGERDAVPVVHLGNE